MPTVTRDLDPAACAALRQADLDAKARQYQADFARAARRMRYALEEIQSLEARGPLPLHLAYPSKIRTVIRDIATVLRQIEKEVL